MSSIVRSILAFFGGSGNGSGSAYKYKGVSYGTCAEGSTEQPVLKCLFCDVTKRVEPGTIVYENDDFSVFRTIRPYTDHHLLVCPKEHIQSVKSLNGEAGAKIVENMVDAGQRALNAIEPNLGVDALMCFHIPPVNSIDHLHLHAIGKPQSLSFFGSLKYWPGTVYCHSAQEVIQRLRGSNNLQSKL